MTIRMSTLSSFLQRAALICAITGLAACGNEPTRAVPVDAKTIIWRLKSEPRGAVVVAVDDTLQLMVGAINIDQGPVPVDPGMITYTTSNSSYVTVSPAGLLRAVRATPPTSPVTIVASYKAANAVRADTTIVAVTAERLAIDSISFAPDSARVPYWSSFSPNAVAWGGGVRLPNVYIGLRVRAPGASATASQVSFSIPGTQSWVYASTNAYGHTYSDSLLVSVLYWSSQSVSFSDGPTSNSLVWTSAFGTYIQPCGTISWYNGSSAPIDITFDTPEQTGRCGVNDTTPTGNIVNLGKNATATRRFPGTYSTAWTASRTSAPGNALTSGTIVTK